MLKEITLSYDLRYDASKYSESGFYKVIDPDGKYIAEVVVVLKEANLVCLLSSFTEDIEKSINSIFQSYSKKQLDSAGIVKAVAEDDKKKGEDVESIISFDDVLKMIAVIQDPRVIKDLVK